LSQVSNLNCKRLKKEGKALKDIYPHTHIPPFVGGYKFISKILSSPYFWQMCSRELEMTGPEYGLVNSYLSENFTAHIAVPRNSLLRKVPKESKLPALPSPSHTGKLL
jgi:hypothetical protein